MGPGGPARQRWSAGSTTNRRPDLERGPSRASVHTEAWARRTARAPARRHATAARCRLAAIKNSFQRSVQWSPAMHREQPVGGLRGGSARRASGVGKHLIRRRSKLERPAERRQDGAEGLQPLGPSAGRAPASTPTQSVDGRCLARLGQGSCARTRPAHEAAARAHGFSGMPRHGGHATQVSEVGVVSQREALGVPRTRVPHMNTFCPRF